MYVWKQQDNCFEWDVFILNIIEFELFFFFYSLYIDAGYREVPQDKTIIRDCSMFICSLIYQLAAVDDVHVGRRYYHWLVALACFESSPIINKRQTYDGNYLTYIFIPIGNPTSTTYKILIGIRICKLQWTVLISSKYTIWICCSIGTLFYFYWMSICRSLCV